jgi:hypothetical protein
MKARGVVTLAAIALLIASNAEWLRHFACSFFYCLLHVYSRIGGVYQCQKLVTLSLLEIREK